MYLKRTYGPISIVQSAAGAGISQWRGAPKEWKQGAEAYGDRFGNSYAKHVIRGTLEYGASAMLREDNRYVPSLDTGFWKRTRHAIASTFVARNDGGHEHFAYSRFGSARLDYGNSNWDIRHRFVTHYLYELPFFRESKGILRTALGDWKLSGITTLQSGLPFNVTISTDKANTSARGLYRPNLVGTPSANCGRRRLSGCISTAAFEIPPQYTYGTAGRNLFHGPHLFDTDLSIAKNWSGISIPLP